MQAETASGAPLAPGEHRIFIPGPQGALQALVSVPAGARADALAVICHPHSLMGGSLDNKVVFTLHRAARDQGLISIRFNFRGVGQSAGAFDQGVGEQDDLLAVLDWARSRLGLRRLWLAGFSFGAFVAAMAWPRALAAGWSPLRLVLAAPPVTRFPLQGLQLPAGTDVIHGDADEVVDPQAITDWLATQSGARSTVFTGAGHFFHGRLPDLKDWADAGLQELLHD